MSTFVLGFVSAVRWSALSYAILCVPPRAVSLFEAQNFSALAQVPKGLHEDTVRLRYFILHIEYCYSRTFKRAMLCKKLCS